MFNRTTPLDLKVFSPFRWIYPPELSGISGIIVLSPVYSGCSPVLVIPCFNRNVYLNYTVLKLTDRLL